MGVEIGAATLRPVSLFYSYSHRDEEFRSALETHLSVLRRSRLIAEWHDRMIGAGGDWKDEIDRHLASADIVLLLVSADFIASDYCWSEEMAKALQRHERGEARVIPVILRPCRWRSTPLAKLQAVPRDGKPVTDWLSRDTAFDDVAAAIQRIIEDHQQERLRAAEEERWRAEEETKRKAEEDRKRREQEEAEARRKAEEERLRAEAKAREAEEQRRHGEVEARRRDEEERQRHAREKAEPMKPEPQWRGWTLRRLREAAVVALVAGIVGAMLVIEKSGQKTPPVGRYEPSTPTPVPSPAPKKPPLRPGETFADCRECPKMVVMPGGSFIMGSPPNEAERDDDEGPQRQVTIKPFAIGELEVTFDEWDACVDAGGCNGYRPGDNGWGRGSRPVMNVSWNNAKAYVGWLSDRTSEPYRLPTEAEWEYAARAGTTTPFSFGATITTAQANYNGNYTYGPGSRGKYRQQTVPAGSLPANLWGLHEVHGNVWEWVEDCYHDSYRGAPRDGSAWYSDEWFPLRVLRGGSGKRPPEDLRSANRDRLPPDNRYSDVGFRVARTLD